jgi:membrane-associated phospholipid phosphatase
MFSVLVDTLGFYGPIIMFLFVTIAIRKQTPFFISYVLGFFVNAYLNKILKVLIREPRPNGSRNFTGLDNYENEEQFGMPSGHAQSVFYSILFYFYLTQNWYILVGSLFLGILTLYQRWKYKNHSVKQLIIGSLIGILFSFFVFYLTKKNLFMRTLV